MAFFILMTDTILCVDIGTSSLKAALLSDNLKSGEIFVSRQYFSQDVRIENRVACEWLSSLASAIWELKSKNPGCQIKAVCVSGNGPTVVSDDGTTLLYSDIFVSPTRGRIPAQRKKELRNTKSLFIPRFFGFREIFGKNWKTSEHIFGAPEFLIHELTGKACSILPEERFLPAYWNSESLEACGFSEGDCKKFPPFVSSSSFIGNLTARASLEIGLSSETPVFAGAPDFVVALIGTGTVLPGRLCYRAGTSEGLNLCTSKPVFAEGLRTLPSVVPGLWNLSYLLKENTIEEFSHGISLLKNAAVSNGEVFPDLMTITGGKALDDKLISQKEATTGLKIKKMPCADAELLGDLILARVGLGDYKDIPSAVSAVLG